MKVFNRLLLNVFSCLLACIMLFVSCSSASDVAGDKDKNNNVKDVKTDLSEQNDVVESDPVEETITGTFTLLSNRLNSRVERYKALDYNTVTAGMNIKAELGDGFESLSDDVEALRPAYDYVSRLNVRDVEAEIAVDSNENVLRTTAGIYVNDEFVIDGNVIVDADEYGVYFSLPEVSDDVFYIDLASTLFGAENSDTFVDLLSEENMLNQSVASDELALLIFDEESAEIVVDYVKYVFELLGECEESEILLSVDSVSKKVRCETYEIDGVTVNKISVSFLEKLKNDERFKKKFVEVVDFYIDNILSGVQAEYFTDGNDLYNNSFIPAVEEAISELESEENVDESIYTIDIYYDENMLSGFSVTDGSDSAVVYSFRNGESSAFRFDVSSQESNISICSSGKTVNGIYNGKLTLYDSSSDLNLEFDFQDFDVKEIDDGVYRGTVSVNCNDIASLSGIDLPEEAVIRFTVDTDSCTYNKVRIIAVYGGEKAIDIEFDCFIKETAEDFDIPDDYLVYNSLSEGYMADYTASIVETLFENLIDAGVSSVELLKIFASSAV